MVVGLEAMVEVEGRWIDTRVDNNTHTHILHEGIEVIFIDVSLFYLFYSEKLTTKIPPLRDKQYDYGLLSNKTIKLS